MSGCTTKRAFTLVELLVVIAIISLLLGILLPVLQKAREGGRVAVCKSLLHNYTLTHYSYFIETNTLLPLSVKDPIMRPWYTLDEFRSYIGLKPLSREYKDRRMGNIQEYKPSYERKFICPDASVALKHPEDGLYPMDRSFGLNEHVYYAGQEQLGLKEAKLRLFSQSSRIVCMADSLDWWFMYGDIDKYARYGEVWKGLETYGMASFRHGKKANISFWDGRCEQMTLEQLNNNLKEWLYSNW